MTLPFLRLIFVGFHRNNANPSTVAKTVEISSQFGLEQPSPNNSDL